MLALISTYTALSQVAAVSCDDTDGDLFCLGTCPAEERLVRVLRLRQEDVHWHTNRLTLARELRGLKDNAQNRTSAFFLDARTSLVHDTYPKLLWDARHSLREGPVAGDAAPPEDLQKREHYLVTEMQPGWRPLTSYEFPGPAQAVSILEQACWALAVAESAHEFEHRLPVLGTVLVRPTRSPRLEFTLRGRLERISSAGYKIRLQGLQMARMTTEVPQCTELSRHREFILGEEESHVFGKMASLLSNQASRFKPLTNVMWLQHLARWLSRQSAETNTALAPWVLVLNVATSAQDVAEETADVTAHVVAGRRPLHLMRRRPKQTKQPKQNAPRPADQSGGIDHPSATGSSQQTQRSGT
ncbi:serine/threonine-protein kinase haspin homolog [Dermacentor silvarum]|uniref:serine/threonine-protein kinase haspin homolog n=1 Tax=Dermacentor silvarum TaxID=543639 RepID=UPI00210188E1|nr:serine/threonine-protein kinase haspin homolog [Dermacentor silvarum]